MEYTDIKLTEEQKLKLQALYEAENPKPRNREERRRQKFGKNVKGVNKIYENKRFRNNKKDS